MMAARDIRSGQRTVRQSKATPLQADSHDAYFSRHLQTPGRHSVAGRRPRFRGRGSLLALSSWTDLAGIWSPVCVPRLFGAARSSTPLPFRPVLRFSSVQDREPGNRCPHVADEGEVRAETLVVWGREDAMCSLVAARAWPRPFRGLNWWLLTGLDISLGWRGRRRSGRRLMHSWKADQVGVMGDGHLGHSEAIKCRLEFALRHCKACMTVIYRLDAQTGDPIRNTTFLYV